MDQIENWQQHPLQRQEKTLEKNKVELLSCVSFARHQLFSITMFNPFLL